jgi:flagellar hook-associated protein FlgK
MVAITNDSAYALMTLSKRFAETAEKVTKASTSGFCVERAAGKTTERQPSALPTIQSKNAATSGADGESGIDLGQEMVPLHTTETYYAANLRMVATKDELLGTVLNLLT